MRMIDSVCKKFPNVWFSNGGTFHFHTFSCDFSRPISVVTLHSLHEFANVLSACDACFLGIVNCRQEIREMVFSME